MVRYYAVHSNGEYFGVQRSVFYKYWFVEYFYTIILWMKIKMRITKTNEKNEKMIKMKNQKKGK